MQNEVVKGNKSGISLVTLIIMIVVIIILAGIVMYSQFGTVDTASYAKYLQEFEEVRKSVETVRLSSTKEDIQNIDQAFSKVKVEGDIPYSFMTIPSSGEKQAYLVNLNVIGCDALLTGRDYKKKEPVGGEIQTVKFGVDDVYVYDSRGTLYYVRGYDKDGTKDYEGGIDSNASIKIINVAKMPNGNQTKVTVTIESVKEVKEVLIGGKIATKVTGTENQYEIEIEKSGTYDIIARDVEDNQAKSVVVIEGIGSSDGISVSASLTNEGATMEGDVYVIKEKTAKIAIDSPNAKYLYIGNTSGEPTEYLSFLSNVERYFEKQGDKILYIWVKDDNGKIASCQLNIRVDLSYDKPTASKEQIESGDKISYIVEPSNDVWAKEKTVTIQFPERELSSGYKYSYQIKSGNLGTFSNWKNSYTADTKIPVTVEGTNTFSNFLFPQNDTKETVVVSGEEFEVKKIDTDAPIISAFYLDDNAKLIGTATDIKSGLGGYCITQKYYNLKITKADDITWKAVSQELLQEPITATGKWYFYVRDNVGNIAVTSKSFTKPDTDEPIIDSNKVTSIENYAIIKTEAHDDVGITAYALVKDDTTEPLIWTEISETQKVTIENTATENGTYYIWVRDGKGNKVGKETTVKLYEYPELEKNTPEIARIQVGGNTNFTVNIKENTGEPPYNVANKMYYTYHWQVSKDNGKTWEDIQGATGVTYSKNNASLEDDKNLYRCAVTNPRGTIYSPISVLEVIRISTVAPSDVVETEKEMVFGGIILNDGDTTTKSNTIRVKIVAINAAEVNISDTGTKAENNWIKYGEVLPFTLSSSNQGAGQKTISVWVRDSNKVEAGKVATAQITKINE